MRHYKAVPGVRLSFAAIAILIPLAGSVNYFRRPERGPTKSLGLMAGCIPVSPLPPPKGTAIGSDKLVADGIPVPPLPPPKLTLVADGIPVPPLSPPKGGNVATLAA